MRWEENEIVKKWSASGMAAYIPDNIYQYDETKENILVISHSLDRAGAPLVLLDLMKQYRDYYNVVLISMKDGILRDEILKNNIPVFICMPVPFKKCGAYKDLDQFKMVWINTIICHGFLQFFQNKEIAVYWWIHEADSLLELYYERMPELPLYSENIAILSVSRQVQMMIKKLYQLDTEIMPMPVEDVFMDEKEQKQSGKVRFFMPAKCQRLKGQDVVVKAILNLPEEYRAKTEFVFAGGKDEKEPDYYELLLAVEKAYPNTVKVLGEVSKERVYEEYEIADCVLAPSRQDATPTTMVEAMMFQKLCLCSDGTGISRYLENGINAFIVKKEDEEELLKKIIYIVDHIDGLDGIAKAGRKVYLENFETSVVREKLQYITKVCITNREKIKTKEEEKCYVYSICDS